MRRGFILASVCTVTVTVGVLWALMPQSAQAATSPIGTNIDRMVLFAHNVRLDRADVPPVGVSDGDQVYRDLAVSWTQDGPNIGVEYTQSTVISYNPQAGIDVRRVDLELDLPGGWIFLKGMSTLPIGTVPQPGWTATYAVIGGTGIFAGAGGFERTTELGDGTTFKVVVTLVTHPNLTQHCGTPLSPSDPTLVEICHK